MKVTSKNLIKKGYKRHESDFFCKYAKCFYQKRFIDDKGIKYFIEFYEYEEAWEVEMHTEKEEYCINTKFYGITNKNKIETIEEKLEEVWEFYGSNYYEQKVD